MDPALDELIARGDRRQAAALLVHQHAPAVFALCRAMVRDRQLAEDLSQDAFARAFAALDGFRAEASPRTWLLKIARNRCLDHLDRARRAPWGRDPDPDPDDHIADDVPITDLLARREDAERAIAALAEHERALVVLHFGHGVGYPELADSFGIGQGAVRMRVSRALARMRDALAADQTWDRAEEAADDLAITGRLPIIRRENATLDDFADEECSASLAEDSDFDAEEMPTGIRDGSPVIRQLREPALVSTLREEVSTALWGRLGSLAASVA